MPLPIPEDFVPATRFAERPDLEIRFPPLPKTVADVSVLLANTSDTPDTERLIEIVNSDPVVALSVLRRINSAYYGLPHRVGEIRRAALLLGFTEVSNLVMASGMMRLRDVISSPEQIRIFDQIIRLSIGTALITRELAVQLRLPGASLAFTAGLLHPLGRLVLLYNKPHDYEALWCTCDNGLPEAGTERRIFGTDHARLGAFAAEHWNLPEEIGTVLRFYHSPDLLVRQDYTLHSLALTVLAASAAAEQFLLRKQPAGHFRAPEALHDLARLLHTSSDGLTRLIVALEPQTRCFTETLVNG